MYSNVGAGYAHFLCSTALKFCIFALCFLLYSHYDVLQAAIVNSQTLEEVARLEKVHLIRLTEKK